MRRFLLALPLILFAFAGDAALSVLQVVPVIAPGSNSPILQMPGGVTGQQTVDVGTGSQDMVIEIGPTPGNARPVFYVVASDGVTDVQVTSNTTNPMTVTFDQVSGQSVTQRFIFHGDWGITINKIKVKQVNPSSLLEAGLGWAILTLPAVTVDSLGRGIGPPNANSAGHGIAYGQVYYYFGPTLSGHGNEPSKGYWGIQNSINSPELAFEPCNKLVPYVSCPPDHSGTEDTISGLKVDSVTQSPGKLSSLLSSLGGTPHSIEVPTGTFAATGRFLAGHTLRGQGIDTTILDIHAIDPAGGKGVFDLEACCGTIADVTLKNAIIGNNGAGIFFGGIGGPQGIAGYVLDHIKLTWNEDGIRGNASSGSTLSAFLFDLAHPMRLENSIVTDNGNDSSQQHETYVNGGICYYNNTQIIGGPRPDHALKNRCSATVVNGGTISGCTDPFAETCGSVIDLGTGGTADIQGMYSEQVGGTVHTGDVLHVTIHSLFDASQSDVDVAYTVIGGDTAVTAATGLLTALKANTTLSGLGYYFSAANTAKSTDTSDKINVFGTGYQHGGIKAWTITPSVTGGGATTTLTQSLTPADITLTSNVQRANGSSMIIGYGAEFAAVGGFTSRVSLENVHVTNQSPTEVPIIRSYVGGEIHMHNCKFSGPGGIYVAGGDLLWARIFGSCVSDSINIDPATISADGTTSAAPAGGNLITQEGTWSWGSATSGGNYHLLLNGVDSAADFNGSYARMRVAHNGTMFAQNATPDAWNTWHGGQFGWFVDIDPTTITADGTLVSAPGGTVKTWEGTWTFGAASGSDFLVLLNGSALPGNVPGVQFKVAHGGMLYLKQSGGNWAFWDGVFETGTPP